MKTFEERYCAWVDGQLTGPELAAFEAELDNPMEAQADQADLARLSRFLRERATAPELAQGEEFSRRLRERIAAEARAEQEARPRAMRRLLWAGAASLAIAVGLWGWLIPPTVPTPAYLAEIVNVQPGDPSISATAVHDEKDQITLVWIDGLDYLPATYKLQ